MGRIGGLCYRLRVRCFCFLYAADTDDYRLDSYGTAINFKDRVEARQELDLQMLGFPGASLQQDVPGLKYRVYGDILYTAFPQVSVGVQ